MGKGSKYVVKGESPSLGKIKGIIFYDSNKDIPQGSIMLTINGDYVGNYNIGDLGINCNPNLTKRISGSIDVEANNPNIINKSITNTKYLVILSSYVDGVLRNIIKERGQVRAGLYVNVNRYISNIPKKPKKKVLKKIKLDDVVIDPFNDFSDRVASYSRFYHKGDIIFYLFRVGDADFDLVRNRTTSFLHVVNSFVGYGKGICSNSYFSKFDESNIVVGAYVGAFDNRFPVKENLTRLNKKLRSINFRDAKLQEEDVRPVFDLIKNQRSYSLPMLQTNKLIPEYSNLVRKILEAA